MDCAKAVDEIRIRAVATAVAAVVNRESRVDGSVGGIEGVLVLGWSFVQR